MPVDVPLVVVVRDGDKLDEKDQGRHSLLLRGQGCEEQLSIVSPIRPTKCGNSFLQVRYKCLLGNCRFGYFYRLLFPGKYVGSRDLSHLHFPLYRFMSLIPAPSAVLCNLQRLRSQQVALTGSCVKFRNRDAIESSTGSINRIGSGLHCPSYPLLSFRGLMRKLHHP